MCCISLSLSLSLSSLSLSLCLSLSLTIYTCAYVCMYIYICARVHANIHHIQTCMRPKEKEHYTYVYVSVQIHTWQENYVLSRVRVRKVRSNNTTMAWPELTLHKMKQGQQLVTAIKAILATVAVAIQKQKNSSSNRNGNTWSCDASKHKNNCSIVHK